MKIRKYKDSDIDLFFEAVVESKNEIRQWLPWCHKDYSLQDTQMWIKEKVPKIWREKRGCEFVIVSESDKEVFGGCCLENLDLESHSADIAYWIRSSPNQQRAGCVCMYFFNELWFWRLKPSID